MVSPFDTALRASSERAEPALRDGAKEPRLLSASGARPNGFHLDLASMVYVKVFVAARIGLCGKATGRGVSYCF